MVMAYEEYKEISLKFQLRLFREMYFFRTHNAEPRKDYVDDVESGLKHEGHLPGDAMSRR